MSDNYINNGADTAANNGRDKWAQNLHHIAKRYVDDGWTWDQIATELSEIFGTPVKGPTVKAHLKSWNIKRLRPEGELQLLAQCLLHARAVGQQVAFRRLGEDYPMERVLDYLARNDGTMASDQPLPAYFEIVLDDLTSATTGSLHTRQDTPQNLGIDDDTAAKNRRRSARQPAAVRPDAYPSRSGARKEPSREEHQESQDDGPRRTESDSKDEEGDDSTSADKLSKVAKALSTIKALSQELGLRDTEIKEALEHPDKLQELAKERADYKQTQERTTDMGPLLYAAMHDNPRIINKLIGKGAKVNARGGQGFTALHIAAALDKLEALGALLDVEGVDLNAVDDQGLTPLSRAIIDGESLQCALALVLRGADVDMDGVNGRTTLHRACLGKNMKPLIIKILQRTKRINKQDDNGHTALHLALHYNKWDYAELLLDAGADLNVQDTDGRTPMHFACFEAGADLLRRMLNTEGVDFSLTGTRGETVLHLLCQRDVCDLTQLVVQKPGVDINAEREDGITPVILASLNGSYDTVKMLIEWKADLSHRDADLDTALTMAIRYRRDDVAELLIDAGCPLEPKNQSLARYQAERQSHRVETEVSSFLNRDQRRFKVPSNGKQSIVLPRSGTWHAEHELSPSLHISGMPGLSVTQLQALFNQIQATGSRGGFEMSNGASASDLDIAWSTQEYDASQTHVNAGPAHPNARLTGMNMHMRYAPQDLFGSNVDLTSNTVGTAYLYDGMELS